MKGRNQGLEGSGVAANLPNASYVYQPLFSEAFSALLGVGARGSTWSFVIR